jgi:sulfur relay (sulfurtransferase) DsrC/TusE family protein
MQTRNGPEWTPETAEVVAREAGIGPLTPEHWTVLVHYREDTARRGFAPCLRRLAELTGLREARIGQLFPGSPASLVARIAGLGASTERFHDHQGRR